jgi:hypothetical protein
VSYPANFFAKLKPHRVRTFKLSNDAKFAAKVQDVVGLYIDPPEHALVLSVDGGHLGEGRGSRGRPVKIRARQQRQASTVLGSDFSLKSGALNVDRTEALPCWPHFVSMIRCISSSSHERD